MAQPDLEAPVASLARGFLLRLALRTEDDGRRLRWAAAVLAKELTLPEADADRLLRALGVLAGSWGRKPAPTVQLWVEEGRLALRWRGAESMADALAPFLDAHEGSSASLPLRPVPDARALATLRIRLLAGDPAQAAAALRARTRKLATALEERAQLARELRAREQEAQRNVAFQEELMGIVGHDLKSPLGALKMGLQLLRRAELAAPDRAVVERMGGALQAMERLVGELLDFTATRLGESLALRRDEADLSALVRRTADRVSLHRRRPIALSLPKTALLARVDAARLEQALANLLENAFTHGEGTVTASLAREERVLVLSVHDEGGPIPAQRIAALFAPLESSGDGAQHLGLGLYVVDQVAKAHGGRVDVRSLAGEGTRFTLRLPEAPAPNPEATPWG
ncbi:MAG: HAMP domain-containing sensor histidine kinase [Myxococcota bacterium]